jgi:hypothetical protein
MYNFNIQRLVEILLSPRLLVSEIYYFTISILDAVRILIDDLNAFVADVMSRLSYNGQVCHLERLLNDKFDLTNRGIYITDAESIPPLIAYSKEDVLRRIIISDSASFENYKVIARARGQIGSNSNKFIINIPNDPAIVARENELIATVKLLKLAGTIFIIKYY